jgi:hypothetical protein
MARRIVRLVATAHLEYGGRSFSKGEFVDAPAGDAHMLVVSGKALLPEESVAAAPIIADRALSAPAQTTLKLKPTTAKRAYNRRDMTAEK